ncbi:MAG: DEAD/DEAH box helicase [Chloroflexi bacterium]|nr:MAG: DEAD/DEAH box helicase [Chloroflexota bacterium]
MTGSTAEVAVFAGVRGPARTFTYAVPEGLALVPGHLVRVGFGPRSVAGVVVRLDAPYQGTLRAIDALVHPLPLLRAHQLALAAWIATEYRCGIADAVRAMLPPALAGRARAGLPTARGDRREPVFALTPAGRDALSGSARLGARQLVTLRALEAGAVSSADLADAGGSSVAARALAKRGLVLEGARSVRRIPREFALGEDDAVRDASATAGQADALGTIVASLGTSAPFLLHGVTASGKTEVYLRAAARALAMGYGVIVLVPEIALTAQVVARFVARFGERVALLHSALSAGERYDEWRRVLDGMADVVVGSRSALFAPLERPGLVIVDEEQEPSYKQESALSRRRHGPRSRTDRRRGRRPRQRDPACHDLPRGDDRGFETAAFAGASERADDAADDDRRPASRAEGRQPRHAVARSASRARAHGRQGRAGHPLSESPRVRDRRAVSRLRVRRELSGL